MSVLSDRYLVISSDGHAGLPPERYRDYLDARYHAEFDAALPRQIEATRRHEEAFLVKDFNQRWRHGIEDQLQGAWNSSVRNAVIDGDGVVAEVLFPDGITEMNAPPFGAGISLKPWGVAPELQWAGARAHNRWLAEFCAEEPLRRIGVAVVPLLYDIEQALAEIRRAHADGLKGVMMPSLHGDYPAYNDPRYYPVWELCQALDMPLHLHSGAAPDYDMQLPGAMGVYLVEFAWWTARPLWEMIFGGVFERYPRLKLSLTEVSEFWVPAMLEMMDVRASVKHTSGKLGDFRSNLTMPPSAYFRRNCRISASALFDEGSTAVRAAIGIDAIMWGTDYPHPEGSWPHTRKKMRQYLTGIAEPDLDKMLGLNAVAWYGLDVDALAPIAARIGPFKTEFRPA
jgi:predicted TIM-barrel fold metal-dependent hydrolase